MGTKINPYEGLPPLAGQYITTVIRKMGYSRKARLEVRRELIDHFTDALRECTTPQERDERAKSLIEEFGDPRLLAVLIRRGKERCRPLWKKAVVRSFQAMGLLIAFVVLYVIWFYMGTPSRTTDYLTELNELSRPNVPTQENAWPLYEQAMKLYVKPGNLPAKYTSVPIDDFLDGKLGPSEKETIEKWIKANEPAWKVYVAASEKPYCWQEYKAGKFTPTLISIVIPTFGPLRRLTEIGVLKAEMKLSGGQVDESLKDVLVIARTGKNFAGRSGFLIEQMVGMSMVNTVDKEIMRLAAGEKLSPANLTRLQEQLTALYGDGFPTMSFEAERLSFLDMVQSCYTSGGPGGGHLAPKTAMSLQSVTNDWNHYNVYACIFSDIGRDETVRMGSDYYLWLNERAKLSPYQRRTQAGESSEDYILKLSPYRHAFLRLLLPPVERAADINFQSKATYDAAITVLALRRWRLEKGQYPDSLEELKAGGYIKSLPPDPYSASPLVYCRTNGDFILYSVGEDFKDDGGVSDPKKPWQTDRVFWPVE